MTTNGSSSNERTEQNPAKQTSVVFAGQVMATGMGFVASLLTMRAVGPDGYGVIVVSTTVLTVIWLVTGRGVDQAMVRCTARFSQNDPDSANATFATVHQIKLALGGALVLIGLMLAVPLSRFFFGPNTSALAMGIAIVVSLAATLWSYVGASLQATFKFRRFALVQASNAAGRLLLTVALVVWGILSPVSAMLIVGAGYLIAAGVGYALATRAVRGLAARVLKGQGYSILEASNGVEALNVVQKNENTKIDLLLTDVVMPLMGGRELADKLRAKRPGIKVLFTSGYTDEAIIRHGSLDPDTAFTQKPFSATDLALKVREVLEEPSLHHSTC